MPRTHFSAAVKRHAIDLVLLSKHSVTEVAQQVGCSIHAIHSWLRKHRQEQESTTASPPTFVPVTLADPSSSGIEIILPNGITLRLSDASPKYLAELLHAIAQC
jgi:transposase-like protein